MSYCTPCPPCDTNFPLLCEPLEITSNAKRLVVEDSAACQKTLVPPLTEQLLKSSGATGQLTWTNGSNNSIVVKDSSGSVGMKDGSSTLPIVLPNISQDTTSVVPKQIVMLADGTIKVWEPSVTGNNYIAYWDGSDWRVNTLNTLLPSGQGLFIRDTSNNLTLVPNGISGSTLQMVGSSIQFVAAPSNQFPGGHLYGMILSNNVSDPNNDIDISVGECRSANNTADLLLTSAITKRSDAPWAAGTNQGGMDVGTKPNNGTLHVYIISDGTVQDAIFSTSVTSPALPGGYTQYRRIGAVTTDGSGNIRAFVQVGDRFLYKTPSKDVQDGNINSGGSLFALSVPSGIKVYPIINIGVNTAQYWKAYDPDQTFPATMSPSFNNASATAYLADSYNISAAQFNPFGVMTNTSREIGIDLATTTSAVLDIDTFGYIDGRGRLQP